MSSESLKISCPTSGTRRITTSFPWLEVWANKTILTPRWEGMLHFVAKYPFKDFQQPIINILLYLHIQIWFDLNPKWERTLPSFGSFSCDIYRVPRPKSITRVFIWFKCLGGILHLKSTTERQISTLLFVFWGTLWISHAKLPKNGKVLSHLEFNSKVIPRPLTDLSANVEFCTSSPQQGVKYQLWYFDF